MFDSLARLANGRARRIGLIAIVFFLLAGALGGGVADRLDPYGAEDPATEAIEARETLKAAGFKHPGALVVIRNAPVATAAGRRKTATVARELRAMPQVESVAGYLDTRSPDFVSADGRTTYLTVTLAPTDDKEWQEASAEIVDRFAGDPDIIVGGAAVAQEQVNKQVESDLQKAEMLAFPLLFLLSLLFFRSLVAALLPLMIGATAIVGTFLILRLASELGSISIFALNLTTALGLGLSIDYSLFIVSRYREEIAKDGPGLAAMRRVLATAGRTVFFSSLTVSAALASLLVFPQRFLYSMGLGGALVALFAALISLTVLPAVLTMLGDRVNSLSPSFLRRRAEAETRPDARGFWYRLSRFVMRRPVGIASASAALLIVLGIPFFGIQFDTPDAKILPEGASAREAYDIASEQFPPNREVPILITVRGGDQRGVAALRREVATTAGIDVVRPPQRLSRNLTLLQAISENPFPSRESRATVELLRELKLPGAEVEVSGATAEFVDFQGSLARHMPIALAIVIVSTLVILFLMTGSVVLPIKSLIMSFLNLSAVFGILVFIFQDGRLEGLLAYTSTGAIEQTMPILLFAVAFGLSTDYAVFLLSRIKEARDGGASESECVAIGLERTGRIVTAAALLFAVALGAFATSQILFIKQNGVGTALAVLIDASIIRALLVPSLMELLGKWNWWAPAPLRRLHDRIGISETAAPEPGEA